MRKLTLLFFLFFSFFAFHSNAQKALDTVETSYGKMVIYSNKTWAFLKINTFDGIMNPRIHKIMTTEQSVPYTLSWNNEVCFTSRNNDLSKLKDTIWLCLNDEEHSNFSMPVPGIVTSRYGPRSGRNHNGIDLDLDIGDTVYAAWSGKVRYAKYNEGGFGNLVVIRHFNGLETFYAHLSKFLVFPDQDVEAGEPIGLGGNTGRSFGPHLHFEVRFYDAPFNPEEIIDFEKRLLKNENLFVHKALFRPGAKPTDFFEANPTVNPPTNSNIIASVPVKETEDSITVAGVVKEQVIPKPQVKKPQAKYYKIRSGDTLTEIADRNNTTVSNICRLNGLKPSSVLQVGRSLRIR